MKVIVDWETYQTHFLGKGRHFVVEEDDSWVFHTDDGQFIIKCTVEKYADQTENVMFVERYLSNNPGIIKVELVDTEESIEELIEEELYGNTEE